MFFEQAKKKQVGLFLVARRAWRAGCLTGKIDEGDLEFEANDHRNFNRHWRGAF